MTLVNPNRVLDFETPLDKKNNNSNRRKIKL